MNHDVGIPYRVPIVIVPGSARLEAHMMGHEAQKNIAATKHSKPRNLAYQLRSKKENPN
jgi:hypothetical protein